jgi:NADH:ubiquinone oxidoreductase subunit F (NADH-binding)
MTASLVARPYPGIEPRLMVEESLQGSLSLSSELRLGTYGPTGTRGLIEVLDKAGLRGRGGAGFPAHIKWRAVANPTNSAVIVANGEEGEPASLKDQWLLRHRPHLVLDGLMLAARTCGARRMIVYLSHEATVLAVRAALAELQTCGTDPAAAFIEIHVVAPTYVAGEETSACRSINGGPALPTSKPPRPCETGVDGLPTLVSNVETLAHAAWIARNGIQAYRSYGTEASPGTTLVTLTGDCHAGGVFEVPYGISLSTAFSSLTGGVKGTLKALLAGGWFGGVLPPNALGLPITFEALREAGSGLGCGTFTALADTTDPIQTIAKIGAWYARETAAQCGICVKGTRSIAETLQTLSVGATDAETLSKLHRWGTALRGRGACALLDGAANLARTTHANFASTLLARIQ